MIQHFLNPPRALVVCDQGMALMDRSLLNGRPSKVIARLHHGAVLGLSPEGGRIRLELGVEHIWLTA